MASPTITVLITTYNYGLFLEQAIDSVLAQDFPLEDVQILVVDDGSTDDTSERVKKYGTRIEYFYKANGGQASALNLGIAKARAEIIALLDADDLFMPGKLARVVEVFRADPTLGMVYHRLQEWRVETDEKLEWEFVNVSGDIRNTPDQILAFVSQPTSAISFRRESLRPLLPVPEGIRMLADCYLVSLILFLAPIRGIPDLLTLYRIHGKNSYTNVGLKESREDKIKKLKMWQILVDAMTKWLSDKGYAHRDSAVRAFLGRWSLFLEGLRVDPPDRIEFFWSLVRYNHTYAPLQTWRLTLFNYLFAPLGLVLGHSKANRFYKWRGAAMAGAQGAIGSILGGSRRLS
jgi:glycosyltransferase involved in cell wall biosynthesis